MAEATWYFAIDDEERGPVTEAQLRTLIGTKNLSRDDLVWREGMEDWGRAGDVPGLFDKDSAARTAEVLSPAPAERRTTQPAPPTTRVPDSGTAVVPPVATPIVVPAPRREAVRGPLQKPLNLLYHVTFLGQPLLLIGFVLVLLSRGCDAVATHYAERVKAKALLTPSRFQDEWEQQKSLLDKQRQQLESRKNAGPADARQAEALNKEIEKLDERKKAEQAELRDGAWRALTIAARDANANNQVWSFWRESVFWLGTTIFALGLLVVGFTGDGPERWLCLVMLAIIVYALYVVPTH